MTDTKNVAVAAGDRATAADPRRTHQSPGPRRRTDVLMHRWPTALGIAVAALAASDLEDGREFAALTVLMALVYLGAAALDRRWSAWVVLLAGLPLTDLIPSISGIDPAAVLLAAAPVFLTRGDPGRSRRRLIAPAARRWSRPAALVTYWS